MKAPDQIFFQDVHDVVERFGFMQNGNCYMQKTDHYATLLTAILDISAKRATNSIQGSERVGEFNAVPCHDITCEGMEAWGLYEVNSSFLVSRIRLYTFTDALSHSKPLPGRALFASFVRTPRRFRGVYCYNKRNF